MTCFSYFVPFTELSQAANGHSTSIQNTTRSVHAETVRVVDEQMKDLDVQMRALDDFVTRARSENSQHHDRHGQSMEKLSSTVGASIAGITDRFKDGLERVEEVGDAMETEATELHNSLEPLDETLCQPLTQLKEDIASTVLR